MSRLTLLPVLLAVTLFGLLAVSPGLAGALALLAVLPQVIRPRLVMGTLFQLLVSGLLLGMATWGLAALFPSAPGVVGQLRSPWAALAGASLLITVLRFHFARPVGGDLATLALALVSITACGGTSSATLYPPVVVLFLVLALLARRGTDAGSAPLSQLRKTTWLAGALLFVLAVAVASTAALGLPRLHGWVIAQATRFSMPSTGFSDRMWLGTMRGMLQSDRKVLRVAGGSPDYLRGIVYTHYRAGRWSRPPGHVVSPVPMPQQLDATEDRVAVELLAEHPQRYFLPLVATQVAVARGVALVDPAAILSPVSADPAKRFWYRTQGERSHAVAPPGEEDLGLPVVLRAPLERIAKQWTEGTSNRSTKLRSLERQLQSRYTYSLQVDATGRQDPILQFLLQHKRGHCEYFASAMALLSRSVGIPARVVAGYRVTERNELGGYYIVRERNAHAWVEAWVPGHGWRSYDPTPPAELLAGSSTRTPLGAALVDLAGRGWTGFLSWLDQRTPLEMLAPPALFSVLLLLVRWLRSRAGQRRDRLESAADPPLPCLSRLSRALSPWGVVRPAGETLEQLAARLGGTELSAELASATAKLLRRYAALRYGNVGDEAVLNQDIERFCRRLQGAR